MDHPLDRHAMADLARPDLGRFPALARVRGTSCVLEPGDALYIPANMLHYVHQLDAGDENLSLNFWFGDGSRGVADALVRGPSPARDAAVAALPPAELRFHVHRILEKSAANLVPEGTQWGRFLTAWSDRGADAFEEPLHRDLAARLAGELAPLLGGAGGVRALLRDMTRDGRLLPETLPAPVVEAHDQRGVATPDARLPAGLRALLRRGP